MPANLQGQRPFNAPRLLIGLIVVAIGLYVLWNNSQPPAAKPQEKPAEQKTNETATVEEEAPLATAASPTPSPVAGKQVKTQIPGVTVRDQNGKVLFRGTVDVSSTLRRIEQGKKLRFSHDGTVFENRERRLPQKPAGYYREYVHPTPGDDGPGPQRIVKGKEGETYYTFDHYRTFQRLDPK